MLQELLANYSGEELKDAVKERMDDLIPKHIIVDDIMASINYLNCLAHGVGTADDIDHLGNRRLRCVGELLQNQFRIGFSRMERVIRERMTIQDLDIVTPQSPHQHPSRHRRHQGVLRFQPPEPVYGPDQPSGRADSQAPVCPPWVPAA